MSDAPWRDETTLRELYVDEELSTIEMGERLGTSDVTIRNWMEKHDIDRREVGRKPNNLDRPWQDRKRLWEKYVEEERSAADIADEWDTVESNILTWLRNHDIPVRRSKAEMPPHFYTTAHGYERWQTVSRGEVLRVYHHRLLAVAEYGFDAVCDMDAHHVNEVPWDNRRENIELLSREDHARHHENYSPKYPEP